MHTIRVKPSSAATRAQHSIRALQDGTEKDAANVDGEYQWSEEIVLTATQKPSKRKEGSPVMLDHFSCAPDNSSSEYEQMRAESKEDVALVAGASTALATQSSSSSLSSSSSSSPSTSRPFYFTCFHSGLDVLDDEEMMDGIEVPKTREFHASIFEIRTPITCENVLAGEASIRLLKAKDDTHEKDEEVAFEDAQIVHEFTLARGHSCPIFAASTAKDTYLSLKLPQLAANWSKPMKLKFKGDSASVVVAHLYGENGGMLPICVELKQNHGSLRVVLYTHYFMWDLSSLGLQVTPDKKLVLPSRVGTASELALSSVHKNTSAHLESVSLPDKHAAVMFGFDDTKSSKGRLYIRAGRHPRANGYDLAGPCADPTDANIQWSEWSEKISVDATSNQSTISMPMGPAKSAGSYEVVVDVQQGEGIYHRTKMVKFLPRFIVLNLLKTPIHIKQYGLAEDAHLTLSSTQQIIWHWPQHADKHHKWLSVRRTPQTGRSKHRAQFSPPEQVDEWHWSGFFSPDTPGDQNVVVRHRIDPSRVWYLHVEVRQRNGINFVMIHEHDPTDIVQLKVVLPYCISNRSHTEMIRVRQYLDVKKHGEESSHWSKPTEQDADDGFAWIEVPPQTERPFCFEEPLLKPHAIQVQVALFDGQGVREWTGKDDKTLSKLELENFEEDHAFIDYMHVSRSNTGINSLSRQLTPAAMDRKRSNPARHRLYYFNEQDGPSNFIVFSDEPSEKWRKEQMRLKRETKIKEVAKESHDSKSRMPVKRSPVAPFFKLKETVTEEEKEHVATLGDKTTGSTTVTQDTLGVHTDEQLAYPSQASHRLTHSRNRNRVRCAFCSCCPRFV
jgi:hypothetical protein